MLRIASGARTSVVSSSGLASCSGADVIKLHCKSAVFTCEERHAKEDKSMVHVMHEPPFLKGDAECLILSSPKNWAAMRMSSCKHSLKATSKQGGSLKTATPKGRAKVEEMNLRVWGSA